MTLLSACQYLNKLRSCLPSWPHVSSTSGLPSEGSMSVCWLPFSSRLLSSLTPSFFVSLLLLLTSVNFPPDTAKIIAKVHLVMSPLVQTPAMASHHPWDGNLDSLLWYVRRPLCGLAQSFLRPSHPCSPAEHILAFFWFPGLLRFLYIGYLWLASPVFYPVLPYSAFAVSGISHFVGSM